MHSFVSVEGRHEVCTLCADRAAEAGWLPADQDGAEEKLRAKGERKPGLLGRLFARPEQPGVEHFHGKEGVTSDDWFEDELSPPPAPDPATRRETHELDTERYDVEAEWRGDQDADVPAERRKPRDGEAKPSTARRLAGFFGAGTSREAEPSTADALRSRDADAVEVPHGQAADLPAPADVPAPEESPAPAAPAPDARANPAALPDPAGRGMRPRRLQPDAGLSPATRFERAIARFNSSDAGRTVAGLTRTLGAPSVSVGDLAGTADEVRVTVAWELTWYQWGVDLGDELRPVYELKKGFEVEEIDAPARQWNASAHDGRIVLVAPHRREAAEGKPVHR
ncbi:MAG TPA: hypothetical protein VJ204_10210 [Solirubrobacterales bacterium]|nr:hypothetical protein [Solirubrobacterales bacterium]